MTHADDVKAIDRENCKLFRKLYVRVFGCQPIRLLFNRLAFKNLVFKNSPANSMMDTIVWYIKNVFGLESIKIKKGTTPKNRSDAMNALNRPSQAKCSAPETQPR